MNCLRHELQRCCMIWLRHDLPCGEIYRTMDMLKSLSEE